MDTHPYWLRVGLRLLFVHRGESEGMAWCLHPGCWQPSLLLLLLLLLLRRHFLPDTVNIDAVIIGPFFANATVVATVEHLATR